MKKGFGFAITGTNKLIKHMRYILSNHIALRSWQLVPYAYYIKDERNAKGLKADEFVFLSSCDGKSELPSPGESPLARRFLDDGLIRRAEGGETLSDWSRPRLCLNRYFPAMNWMITGKCNYNCIHCFNAADNAPLMSEWSMEEADRLLDQARDCGINAFTITGGEPMLHRHFFDILEGIYARGMYVEELNTNGYFIDQQALDCMRATGCVPLVKISFDGIGYHDWMRAHKGAEETALRAIRLCVENGFPVKVQTNMNRRNCGAMLKTAEMLDDMGVTEMRVIRTTEAPRWVQNAGDACLTLEEYFDEALRLWERYAQGGHTMDLTVWQFGTLYPRSGIYTLTAVSSCPGEYRDSAPVCKGNRGMVAVAANGNVFPCHQMSAITSSMVTSWAMRSCSPAGRTWTRCAPPWGRCGRGTRPAASVRISSTATAAAAPSRWRSPVISWASIRPNACSGAKTMTEGSRSGYRAMTTGRRCFRALLHHLCGDRRFRPEDHRVP